MSKTQKRTIIDKFVDKYENPDFAPVIRKTTISTQIFHDGEQKHSSRYVEPAHGVSRPEYCKALVLALARYGRLMDVPYTIQLISDHSYPDCDSALWYTVLTNDNPPGRVSFHVGKDGYEEFRKLIMPIDFRVFDNDRANEIRAMYDGAQIKKVVVDSDLIIQGELGELE